MPLTIHPPTPLNTAPSQTSSASSVSRDTPSEDRYGSPGAPPTSPLTPTRRVANPDAFLQQDGTSKPYDRVQEQLAAQTITAQFIDQPPALPYSGEDSSDAIALRAAISSLQFQRLRAEKDLRILQAIKQKAVRDPLAYSQHLLRTSQAATNRKPPDWSAPVDSEDDGDDGDDESDSKERDAVTGAVSDAAPSANGRAPFSETGEVPDSQQETNTSFASLPAVVSSRTASEHVSQIEFPALPEAQEIVRCPPIEWAKYHISGEGLEMLHRQQQLRPGEGAAAGRESVIAAAYNPFVDDLDRGTQQNHRTGSEARKDSGASAVEASTHRRQSSKAFAQ